MLKNTLMFLLIHSVLYASPALSIKQVFEQKDGTSFEARLRGDEYFSWLELNNGDMVLFNKNSEMYEYAEFITINKRLELKPTGKAVGKNYTHRSQSLLKQKSNKTSFSNAKRNEQISKIWKRNKEERDK